MDGIYKVWIVERVGGICIFEQTFQELPGIFNPDLIGGFLMAILSFAEELAKQAIDFIQLKNLRIIYHITKEYLISVACSNETIHEMMENALETIQKRFDEKYKTFLDGFCGNVSVFKTFAKDVEQIFQAETKYLAYVQKRGEELKEYLEQARGEWENLQELVTKRASGFGTWIKRDASIETKNEILEGMKVVKDGSSKSTRKGSFAVPSPGLTEGKSKTEK